MNSEKQIEMLLQKATATKDDPEKIAYFEEALRLNPWHAEALVRLAASYALQGKNRECLALARRSVESDPTLANGWGLQEHALVGLGIKDKNPNQELCKDQLAWSESYVSRYPNVSQGWYWKAFSLIFLNRNEEALAALDRALGIAPDSRDAMFYRGCVLFDLGRKKEAVQALAHAQQLGHPQAAETMKRVMQTMDTAALQDLANKKSRACFIATAAYGSPYVPEVAILRDYRDQVLCASLAGAYFVQLYEYMSPPLAAWIGKRPRISALVARQLIAPFARWALARIRNDVANRQDVDKSTR